MYRHSINFIAIYHNIMPLEGGGVMGVLILPDCIN